MIDIKNRNKKIEVRRGRGGNSPRSIKKDRPKKKAENGTTEYLETPKTPKEEEKKILDRLELIKSFSNEQLMAELARRKKDKEIDLESILSGIEKI